MQTNDRQHFEEIPGELADKINNTKPKYRTPEAVNEILKEAPRPTLFVGEVVRFKDMNFRVTRIKADGKVGLKMVP